jgi:hypothetical protein
VTGVPGSPAPGSRLPGRLGRILDRLGHAVLDNRWIAGGLLAVTIAAAVGLGLGVALTGDTEEAASAREQAFERAYARAFVTNREAARDLGLRQGEARGRVAGRLTGREEGFDLGGGTAGLQLVEADIASAEAERFAAEAELAERQANCGSIRRAPDICPTDAELAAYQAAVAEAKKPEKPKQPGGGGQGEGQGQGGEPRDG